jgi:ribosomal protein S18 acetylase RimI-like enzyme
MEDIVTAVRAARPGDAQAVARVYIDSWQDTYPSILPVELLCAMTPKGQAARWRAAILSRGGERIFVAECAQHGVVGMTSFGPAHDRGPGFDGEVYTLYVDPDFFGLGIGKALLRAAFGAMRSAKLTSCIIWAHAGNPARFFYEAMGGRLVAQRSRRLMGTAVPEAAFGWHRLSLADRNETSGRDVSRH